MMEIVFSEQSQINFKVIRQSMLLTERKL